MEELSATLPPRSAPPVFGAPAAPRAAHRRSSPWILLPLAGLLPALAIVFAFDPAQHGFYPRCVLHDWTGILCPGCGTLRAAHHLLHGRVGEAFASNALLVAWLPVLVWESARQLAWELRGVTLSPALRHPMWLWSFLASSIVFTAWRNLAGRFAG